MVSERKIPFLIVQRLLRPPLCFFQLVFQLDDAIRAAVGRLLRVLRERCGKGLLCRQRLGTISGRLEMSERCCSDRDGRRVPRVRPSAP